MFNGSYYSDGYDAGMRNALEMMQIHIESCIMSAEKELHPQELGTVTTYLNDLKAIVERKLERSVK